MRLIDAPAVVPKRGVAVDRWAGVTLGRESAERPDTRLPCTRSNDLVVGELGSAIVAERASGRNGRDGRRLWPDTNRRRSSPSARGISASRREPTCMGYGT